MVSSTNECAASEPRAGPQSQTGPVAEPTKSALEHFREYGRDRPEMVALWCFAVGFVLGWKLKLW